MFGLTSIEVQVPDLQSRCSGPLWWGSQLAKAESTCEELRIKAFQETKPNKQTKEMIIPSPSKSYSKKNKKTKAFPLGSTSHWVPPPPPSTSLGSSSEPVGLQEASVQTTTENNFIPCL